MLAEKMPSIREFSIEPEISAARKRRVLALLLAFAAVLLFFLIRDIGWPAFFVPPTLWFIAAFVVLRQSTSDSRLVEKAHLRGTIEVLRGLHGVPFDEACERLGGIGVITSTKKVRLIDPRAWRNLQRQVVFECPPFSVIITEKFSRVAAVSVSIDDEKTG